MNTPDTEWRETDFGKRLLLYFSQEGYPGFNDKAIDDLISSRDTYWKEQLQKAREEERERIIYVTKNIKDAFMSPLTERRWLQCIQFTDQPKPNDQSELDKPDALTK